MTGTEITVNANGPLRVSGQIALKDPQGNTYDLAGRDVVFLCRCGQSANKPFCDGSHKKANFTHEPKAFSLPSPKPKA